MQMAYLDRFENDIFLSHGWAGNNDETTGDRRWVSDFGARLSNLLSQKLSARVSIFIDVDSPRNGTTDILFERHIRQSAILLGIVTPSFCRPDSYCRKELQWFTFESRPVHAGNLSVAERIFKVVTSPVLPAQEPDEVRGHSPYTFYENDPGPNLLDSRLLSVASLDHVFDSRLSREYDRLVRALANLLWDCKRNQADAPIRTIFLAESTSPRQKSLAAQLGGSEIVSCTYKASMTEAKFIEQTNLALAACDRSIHLVDPSSNLSTEPCRPPDWTRSILENQLICAHDNRPQRKASYRQIVWCDLHSLFSDQHLSRLVDDIRDRYTTSGFVDFIPQGFEYLTSNLSVILARTEAGSAQELLPQSPAITSTSRSIYVQCKAKDLGILEPVFRKFYGKFWVQFPVFGGKRDDVQSLHERFLQESDATLIYFGKGPGTWAYKKCDETMQIYGKGAQQKTRLVGLDPPLDPMRRAFRHRHFDTVPFPATSETVNPENLF